MSHLTHWACFAVQRSEFTMTQVSGTNMTELLMSFIIGCLIDASSKLDGSWHLGQETVSGMVGVESCCLSLASLDCSCWNSESRIWFRFELASWWNVHRFQYAQATCNCSTHHRFWRVLLDTCQDALRPCVSWDSASVPSWDPSDYRVTQMMGKEWELPRQIFKNNLNAEQSNTIKLEGITFFWTSI